MVIKGGYALAAARIAWGAANAWNNLARNGLLERAPRVHAPTMINGATARHSRSRSTGRRRGRKKPKRRQLRVGRRLAKKIRLTIQRTAEPKRIDVARSSASLKNYRALVLNLGGLATHFPVQGSGPGDTVANRDKFLGDEYYMKGHKYQFEFHPKAHGVNDGVTANLQYLCKKPGTQIHFLVMECDKQHYPLQGQYTPLAGADTEKTDYLNPGSGSGVGYFTRVLSVDTDTQAGTNKYYPFNGGVLRPGFKILHHRIIKPAQIEQHQGWTDTLPAQGTTTALIAPYTIHPWSHYVPDKLHVRDLNPSTQNIPVEKKKFVFGLIYAENPGLQVDADVGDLYWRSEHHFSDP